MVAILHKHEDGEYITGKFDALDVHTNILHGGWFASKEEAYAAQEINKEENPKEEEEYEEEVKEKILDLESFGNDDIRELAKSAGIEGHDKKRIATLKKELKNGDE